MTKRASRDGQKTVPFDGEKPEYTSLNLQISTRFNSRFKNYVTHYEEATGHKPDAGILLADIVNKGMESDDSFLQKERNGAFNRDTARDIAGAPATK